MLVRKQNLYIKGRGAHPLEDAVDNAIRQRVRAIPHEVFPADQEVMVGIQLPELQ